jgi:hypothetical protein
MAAGVLSPSPAAHAGEKSTVSACATGRGLLKSDELQSLLAEQSLADTAMRQQLVSLMQKPDNRCRKSLEKWLTEIREKPAAFETNTGRLAAVTLGVLLDLPVARQFVESEAASGGGLEWLATLRQWDEKAYHSLLSQWVLRGAAAIRRERGLPLLTAELYGKNPISDVSASSTATGFSPVVFDLFLKSLAERKPAKEELSALNVIFINFNAGARKLYSDSFATVLRKNVVNWMSEFRMESAWAQFQLIELMGQTGGAEMVRELMWISQNHSDVRMKSRAAQILDDSLSRR